MATMTRTLDSKSGSARTPTVSGTKGKVNKTNVGLWVTQSALSLLFLFAGSSKLVMTAEQLNANSEVEFPLWFMRFIGVCELAGGLGLILPSISRIHTGLTPLAACGLIVIMVGAVVTTAATVSVAGASFPLIVGVACAFVAYGRTKLAPISGR
jgi:hypothetical protein